MQTRGRGGVKISKKFADVIPGSPLMKKWIPPTNTGCKKMYGFWIPNPESWFDPPLDGLWIQQDVLSILKIHEIE